MARSFLSLAVQAARAAERAQRAQARQLEKLRHQQKRAKQQDRLQSRIYETEDLNQSLADTLEQMEGLLSNALGRSIGVNWHTLQKSLDEYRLAELQSPPEESSFVPSAPGLFGRMVPGWRTRHQDKVQEGQHRYKEALDHHRLALSFHEAECDRIQGEIQEHNAQVAALRNAYRTGQPEAVEKFFDLAFATCDYPDSFPTTWNFAYQAESQHLLAEIDLPPLDTIIPTVERYRYTKSSDQIVEVKKSQKARHALYTSVVAQTVLRRLLEIFKSDREEIVEVTTLNAYVDAISPATGQSVRPCLISVRVAREDFAKIDLNQVDAVACLKHLKAAVSRSPGELAPVRPIMTMSMIDPRFIKESDILGLLDTRPNLMELSPGEFESLITNLFTKMGLETKLTQASRDGGVDCVAFDMRPVVGGKVIIQAKRYKNTVGVSSVRDLFGTMHNEGASKGILVTTSGYGSAAYEFANGKPMHLIAGGELLSLLQEHAGVDARIVVPDAWRDPILNATRPHPSRGRHKLSWTLLLKRPPEYLGSPNKLVGLHS